MPAKCECDAIQKFFFFESKWVISIYIAELFLNNFFETYCIFDISEYYIKRSSVAIVYAAVSKSQKTDRRCAYGYFDYFCEY